jgi:hypothetical protein
LGRPDNNRSSHFLCLAVMSKAGQVVSLAVSIPIPVHLGLYNLDENHSYYSGCSSRHSF